MTRTDTTPFRDPRNAVGLLTAVLDLALASPVLADVPTNRIAREPITLARDLGREFAKAPRVVFNGYKRRGTADLYQRIKTAYERIPADQWTWDRRRRELAVPLAGLANRPLTISMNVMEDIETWEKFTKPYTIRQYGSTQTIEPEWPREWESHVTNAVELRVDRQAISNLEVEWRWRDLTDRSHRGKNIKAAFEAAWLAGQYKFAQQLIDQEFA